MDLLPLLFIAALIEAVTEYIDMIRKGEAVVENWVATVLGGLLALFLGLDFFAFVGVTPAVSTPIVVSIVNFLLWAILFGRYAGSVNDLLGWLNKLKG